MKVNIRKGYASARKAAYPSIEEQLDMLYHEGFDKWREVIQSVKDRIPKDSAGK